MLNRKRTWKVINNFFVVVDLGYVDSFNYKFSIITSVGLFKDYMDTTHVNKWLIKVYRIVIHLKWRNKGV
jgi:hypothetical protein